MIKVRIRIENENVWYNNLYLECELPAIPSKDDIIHLSNDQETTLENMIKSSPERIEYAEYEYGNGFSINDAIFVHNVRFVPNSEFVDVVLARQS